MDGEGSVERHTGIQKDTSAPIIKIVAAGQAREFHVSGAVFADIVAAYNILRAFSWQLKLSPFSLADLVAAMCARRPCDLLDQLHLNVLRTLASHETSAARRRRRLDLEHLDELTWPEFLWEWLGLVGDQVLAKHRARAKTAHLVTEDERPVGSDGKAGQTDAGAEAAAVADDSQEGPAGRTPGSEAEPWEGQGTAPGDGDSEDGGRPEGDTSEQPPAGDGSQAGEQPVKRKRGRPRKRPLEGDQSGLSPGQARAPNDGSHFADALGQPLKRSRRLQQSEPHEAWAWDAADSDFPLDPLGSLDDCFGLAGPGALDGSGATTETGAGIKADAAPLMPEAAAADTLEVLWDESGGARRPAGPPYPRQSLGKCLRRRRAGGGGLLRSDFYNMPLDANAAVLARLCDDLLEVPSVRAEIDRREAAGQMHAGRGGEGGAWAKFTAAELQNRERRLQAGELDDGNTETCVLCGVVGSLLCCDTCPAAYHLHCLGQRPGSVPDGEWRCPECAVGGRGESAGLRVPITGVNTATGCPTWVAYSCAFAAQCGPPGVGGAHKPVTSVASALTGVNLPPDTEFVGLQLLIGEEAERHVNSLRRPWRWADDQPHPTSAQGLREGPTSGCTAVAASVDDYFNKYQPAWRWFVKAMKAAHDLEYKKSKRAGAVPASALAVPLPMTKFSWSGRQPATRCGKCRTCLNPGPQLRPCLGAADQAGSGADKAVVAGHAGRLELLKEYLLRTERELFGLLDGGWALDGIRGLEFRRRWCLTVRQAVRPEQLAPRLLELEAALRRSLPIFSPQWDPYIRDPGELATLEAMAADRRRDADSYRRRRITNLLPPPKKGPGRPPRKKIPPHLQAWNNLRAAQAAAARATAGSGNSSAPAGTSGGDMADLAVGTPATNADDPDEDDAGAEDDQVDASCNPEQPVSQSQHSAGAAPAVSPADLEASRGQEAQVTEASPGVGGGRNSRRRQRAAAAAAHAKDSGAAEGAPALGARNAAGTGQEHRMLGGPPEDLILDKWWRELLASYGEVDAVDLLGAATAASGEPLLGTERRQALSKARSGWTWWRPLALRTEAHLMLPRGQARKLARQGGKTLLPQGVIYHTNLRHTMSRRLAWLSCTEYVTSVAQLAVQARVFEESLQWERIRRPTPEAMALGTDGADEAGAAPPPPEYAAFAGCVVLAKRSGDGFDKGVEEYLVAPEPGADLRRFMATNGPRFKENGGYRLLSADAGVSRWVPGTSLPLWLIRGFEERSRAEAYRRAVAAAADRSSAPHAAPNSQRPASLPEPAPGPTCCCLVCGLTLEASTGTPLMDAGWVACASAFGSCPLGCHAACLGMWGSDMARQTRWMCQGCGDEVQLRRQAGASKYLARRGLRGALAVMLTPQQLLEQGLADAAAAAAGIDPDGNDEAALYGAGMRPDLDGFEDEFGLPRRGRGRGRGRGRWGRGAGRGRGRDDGADEGVELGRMPDSDAAPAAVAQAQCTFEGGELQCVCGTAWEPDAGMLCCDECEGWFHPQCCGGVLPDPTQSPDQADSWTCPSCAAKASAGLSQSQSQDGAGFTASGAPRPAAGELAHQPVHLQQQQQPLDLPDCKCMSALLSRVRLGATDMGGVERAWRAGAWPRGRGRGRGRGLGPIGGRGRAGARQRRRDGSEDEEGGDYEGESEASGEDEAAAVGEEAPPKPRAKAQQQMQRQQQQPDSGAQRAAAFGGASAAAASAAVFDTGCADGVDDSDPSTWRPAALTILRTLLLEPNAKEFATPVDVSQVPDYLEVVSRPMDLSTVLANLRRGAYTSCSAVAADVLQIGENCRLYNPRGSAILRRAEQLVATFVSAWRQAGLPLPPGTAINSLIGEVAPADERAAPGGAAANRNAGRAADTSGAGTFAAARRGAQQQQQASRGDIAAGAASRGRVDSRGATPAASAGPACTLPPGTWEPVAINILRNVLADPRAAPFSVPVRPEELPGYTEIVSRPVDLGTILRDLEAGKYSGGGSAPGPSELLDEVRLVWSNCRRYNQPGSSIVADAEHCRSAFNRAWQRLAVPAGLPAATAGAAKLAAQQAAAAAAGAGRGGPAGKDVDGSYGAATAFGGGGPRSAAGWGAGGGGGAVGMGSVPYAQEPADTGAWRAAAEEAVQRLMKARVAAIFCQPVDPEEAPGYLEVVSRPMDLSTVMSNLKAGLYMSLGSMLADVEQIWANCRTYNSKSSRVYKLGEQARVQWLAECEAVGIPPEGEEGDALGPRSRRRRRANVAAYLDAEEYASDGGDSDDEGDAAAGRSDDDSGGGQRGGQRQGGRRSGQRPSKRYR